MEMSPTWLWVSGVFFFFGTLMMITLIVLVLKLIKVVSDLTPAVHSLVSKVDGVATKVDTLTTTVNDAVSKVGGNAKSVGNSAEMIAHIGAQQFERFAPLVMGITTFMKVMGAVKEYRQRGKPKAAVVVKELPAKKSK